MKKYLVIGNPIEHSLSPKLHNLWLKENNINAIYEKKKLSENDIKGIIEEVKKICGGGYPQYGKIKIRKDEILNLYPNIKKAKHKIKWEPKISFYKGIRSTIKFYNEHKK